MAETLSWKFPEFPYIKIEVYFVLALALIIFLVSFFQSARNWTISFLIAIFFLVVYVFVSHAAKTWHQEQHHYELSTTQLEVVRTKRNKVLKTKVPLKLVHRHKLDKFFLGGYLLTKQGRKHLLFFNTRKELKKFERYLQRHLKRLQ